MTRRVLAVSGLAACALWAVGLTAWGPLLHGAGHHHGATPALAAAGALCGWALMVTAMMLPAAAPLIRATERRDLVVAGYLGVWVVVGLAAVLGSTLVGAIGLPVALAAAGAYQFTAHKRRSLARCREQRSLAAVDSEDPSGDAIRAGIAHALSTLRCCGPLTALMVLGLGGPVWMLLLGGVMTAEAATPLGARLRIPLGALLLLASVLVLLAGRPPG